jgi:hypothetical protein
VILREPIVGWRQWNFMYPHFLANLRKDTIYVPREKIEARCEQEDHSEQLAPHLTCTCGIYAYKEKPRLLGEIRITYGRPMAPPVSGVRLVYGEINLWGKVIEHEDGYRAQFGYPKRLWCTPAIEPLAGWIGYVYGVPCEVMPSGDGEGIKVESTIIPTLPCGQRYFHVGFCPKCFVLNMLNIKAKRKSIEI